MQVEIAGDLATIRLVAAPVARWHDLAQFDLPGARLGVDEAGRLLTLEAPVARFHPDVLDGHEPGRFTSSDDMGYLYLATRGKVDWTAPVDVEDVADYNLDIDHEGRIVGVEFYDADGVPPGWIMGR